MVPDGPPAPDADTVLVQKLLAGDEAAFATLVRDTYGLLLRLALGFVGSRSVAEEVLQETWVAVLEGLGGFEGRSSLRTWICRILVNRARTRGAREARMEALEPDDHTPLEDPARFNRLGFWSRPPAEWRAQSPEGVLLGKEVRAVVTRELERLPASQRAVVTLRDVEGWTSDEVCLAVGVTAANERVLLHRGRATLRAALERYLGGG